MKKTNLFLLISICGLLSFSGFGQTKTAKQQAFIIVSEFYKVHRQRSNHFNLREVKARKKWFSRELYGLFLNELKREKEYLKRYPTNKPLFGEGLSFQPWEECISEGEFYRNWYKVGKTSVNRNKAVVNVSFYNPQKCENGGLISAHTVELIKEKNKWVINDFVFPSRGPGRFAAYPLTGRLSVILKRKDID
jgi:hypothetical protein